jgi:hypothetical protein
MEGSPPTHDAVRMYLDSAVAEAAERWVGRATDATAYADLVAAVLARREALSPMLHVAERPLSEPPPVRPEPSRHYERRSRPRWPLGSPPPGPAATPAPPASSALPAPSAAAAAPSADPSPAPASPPVGAEGRHEVGLPSRPPGRHRTPPPPPEAPAEIDLSGRLSTVLDWLGRPDA